MFAVTPKKNKIGSLCCTYDMYQFIPLHSCDSMCKMSIKINVATDEGTSRNEI